LALGAPEQQQLSEPPAIEAGEIEHTPEVAPAEVQGQTSEIDQLGLF
jgi:hypothetical protein